MEEASFPDTADNLEEKTLSLGKWVFNLGGVVHDFKDVLKKFQAHMAPRGPDPDEPDRRYLDSVPIDLVRDLLASRGNGNGSVKGDNWKAVAIVLAVFSSLILAWLAWFSNTVIDTRQDVAVIKCQLNPSCRVVVQSVKP